MARVVVEDSVALLFSDGHFPDIECTDATVRNALANLVRDAGLNGVMTEAGLRGSVGSVALQLRIMRGRVFVTVLDTEFLTPVWDPQAPDTLLRVTERAKVTGHDLALQGYGLFVSGTQWMKLGFCLGGWGATRRCCATMREVRRTASALCRSCGYAISPAARGSTAPARFGRLSRRGSRLTIN
jgi:hypothetical protein